VIRSCLASLLVTPNSPTWRGRRSFNRADLAREFERFTHRPDDSSLFFSLFRAFGERLISDPAALRRRSAVDVVAGACGFRVATRGTCQRSDKRALQGRGLGRPPPRTRIQRVCRRGPSDSENSLSPGSVAVVIPVSLASSRLRTITPSVRPLTFRPPVSQPGMVVTLFLLSAGGDSPDVAVPPGGDLAPAFSFRRPRRALAFDRKCSRLRSQRFRQELQVPAPASRDRRDDRAQPNAGPREEHHDSDAVSCIHCSFSLWGFRDRRTNARL